MNLETGAVVFASGVKNSAKFGPISLALVKITPASALRLLRTQAVVNLMSGQEYSKVTMLWEPLSDQGVPLTDLPRPYPECEFDPDETHEDTIQHRYNNAWTDLGEEHADIMGEPERVEWVVVGSHNDALLSEVYLRFIYSEGDWTQTGNLAVTILSIAKRKGWI